jgi:hypothetical protein
VDEMASKAHDFIVQMIGLAMLKKGYEIVSSDGNIHKISDLNFHTPPTLKRHRPDLIGINRRTGKICIGEAKTSQDLLSERTKEQFLDFSSIITKPNEVVEVIIGIPLPAENKLNKILRELEMINKKNIFILKIPTEVLPE